MEPRTVGDAEQPSPRMSAFRERVGRLGNTPTDPCLSIPSHEYAGLKGRENPVPAIIAHGEAP